MRPRSPRIAIFALLLAAVFLGRSFTLVPICVRLPLLCISARYAAQRPQPWPAKRCRSSLRLFPVDWKAPEPGSPYQLTFLRLFLHAPHQPPTASADHGLSSHEITLEEVS